MKRLFSRLPLAIALALFFTGALSSVFAQGTRPTIVAQPHGQSVSVGMDATFQVSAFGLKSPATYQWRFNSTSISGATNSTYTRFNVQFSDAGNYSVAVMNAFGTTLSAPAVLTVNQRLLYWDIDGAIAGPGGTAPAGAWTDSSWSGSPDGIGATTNWVQTSTAFFSAGTTATDPYTVSLNAQEIVGGINFEEGAVTISGNGSLQMTGDGSLSVAQTSGAIISSRITGNSSLIKTGPGGLQIGVGNDYLGDTVISEGILSLDGSLTPNAIPDTSAVTVFQNTTFNLNNSQETIGSLSGSGAVVLGTGSLTVGGGFGDSFFDGTISGSGNITKIGSSTFTLAGNNNFSEIILNGGALEIANPQALGAAMVTAGSGFAEIISRVDGINLQNSFSLLQGATLKISDPDEGGFEIGSSISGSGALLRDSDDFGLVILSGGNEFSGGVTIRGGRLELRNPNALGSGTFTISPNVSTNPVILQASASLTGEDAIQNAVELGGGFTLAGNNAIQFSGPVTVSSSSQVLKVPFAPLTFSGSISGNNSQLVKTGAGTLSLFGGSDYSGDTFVQEGTLFINNSEGSATGVGSVTVGVPQNVAMTLPEGTLTGNGIISGNVSVFGIISPGSSPGQLSTGSETWNSRGHYLWEINDATGPEGGNGIFSYDQINITGTLNIAASSAAPFTIDVSTLTTDNIPGPLANFSEDNSYAWRLVRTTGGILNFSSDTVLLNSSILPVSHGKFSLVVENDGLDLVLHYDPDTAPPVLNIVSPTDNFHTTQSAVTVIGTATDNIAVQSILYQVNGGNFSAANGTTNWSASVPLILGTNTIAVKGVDTTGNESTPLTLIVVLDETSTLTIEIAGSGIVSPNLNGQLLTVGQPYTVTAIAASNFKFLNWSGGVQSTNAELTFVMQTNLLIRATFISTNIAPGIYSGLFYENDEVRHESSGYLTFQVSTKKVFSGKILIEGGTYGMSGRFNSNQMAQIVVPRKGKAPLSIFLTVGTESGHLEGNVVTTNWTAQLMGDLAFANAQSGIAPQAGKYTMTIPAPESDDGSGEIPRGDGYANITVASNGKLQITGRLSEGAQISQLTSISKNGVWPFYRSLYGGKGSIIGWVTFTNTPQSDLQGNLSWIKTGAAVGTNYFAGFTNVSAAFGSRYVKPATGEQILDITEGVALLRFGNLESSIFESVNLSANNVLISTDEPDDELLVRFDLNSGFFRGSFIHRDTGVKTLVIGVVLQKSNEARGFFMGQTQSGSFRVQNDPGQ